MPLIRLEDVSLVYRSQGGQHETHALEGINLHVKRGEHLCVLGANGSGKSTLANVLAGLLAPDTGTVELVGHEVCRDGKPDFAAYREARRKLGLVFQNPDDQIVTSVVEEDVAFGPENLGVEPAEIRQRVERSLKRVGLLEHALDDPGHLSGGQRQRLALASALAMEPEVLILDEPAALLDVRGREALVRLIGRLGGEGVTTVHVTHHMEAALAADRVIVLDQGHIVLEGRAEEVFSHTEHIASLGLEQPFVAQLSGALAARGIPVRQTCCDAELETRLVELAATSHAHDGTTQETPVPQSRPTRDVAVSLSHVSYSYGQEGRTNTARALEDISFDVARGTQLAIVGQTGSGKSTLVRLICALEMPDAGQVTVDGIPTASKAGRRQLRSHIGYVMQRPERQLFAESVREDVAYGPQNMGLTEDEVASRVDDALQLVGLSDKAGASPFELSGGQRRLAAIAGVIAMHPSTLVLDEPLAGLDPEGRMELRRMLGRLHEQDITIIQVTHQMEDVAYADKVAFLNNSRLVAFCTPEELFGDAERLFAAGLGLPQPLAWAKRLKAAGMGDLGEPLTAAALIEAIEGQVEPWRSK